MIAIVAGHTQARRCFDVSCALPVVPARPAHNNVDDGSKLVKHQIREQRWNAVRISVAKAHRMMRTGRRAPRHHRHHQHQQQRKTSSPARNDTRRYTVCQPPGRFDVRKMEKIRRSGGWETAACCVRADRARLIRIAGDAY